MVKNVIWDQVGECNSDSKKYTSMKSSDKIENCCNVTYNVVS